MTDDPIRATLEEWTRDLDEVAARISLFEHVRDIPYSYPASRDPREVLSRGQGSCSGKHYLLGELLRRKGVSVRNMICTHRFNESPIPFPENMQELLRKNEIVDLHDYLQALIDGEWVDIDATWELGLRDFGFPVTDDWDGRTSMLLTVISDEQEQLEGDPAQAKEEMLHKLTPRQRTVRKQFLEALAQFLADLSPEIAREE